MSIQTLADVYTELSILDSLLESVHDNGRLDDPEQVSRREYLMMAFEDRFIQFYKAVTREVYPNGKAAS